MNHKRNSRDWIKDLFEDMERVGSFGITVVRKPNQVITNLRPHYTNEKFRHAQTVYLADGYRLTSDDELVKGATYNYSDRIRQWDWNKAEAARQVAIEKNREDRCTAHIEIYLREFFNDPGLKLVHILAGFNWSDGYDYQVFGYLPGDKTTEEKAE